mmetsp:Transcript_24778/g.65862  ORF Transcript_24778/g.65862 Transcript_24778/m.65862 type:complete len:301 (+) Transcript_24778:693-1595(+)|eukprot:CAMPEP_0115256462 /NCGR_PEP_ID=MMETSP0270-20121206/46262_1 /TAXON_ID=71861 /ORGANISM="Scrippsiella trochoidea, Strain CCMP3099" /LENGTH=300 /DNA_ID=CAMNT_0002672123 /DNA_START=618 /DNA_END=1520 /DNA_ORIENTATION=+
MVAHFAKERFVQMRAVTEDSVGLEVRHVDFLVQTSPEALGHLAEKGDVLLLELLHAGLVVAFNEPLDAACQVRRNPVPPHVLADGSLLPQLLQVQRLDASRCIRHAADEGGDHDQRKQDNAYCEGTLAAVLRSDVVGGRRELRQRPMQGHRVHFDVAVLIHKRAHPRKFIHAFRCNSVPDASNVVVDQHNEDQKVEEFRQQSGRLSTDPAEDHVLDLAQSVHPCQPDEAADPQETSGAERPAACRQDVRLEGQLQHHDDDVRDDDGEVDEEPTGEVVPEDSLRAHLDDVAVLEPHQELKD